MGMCLNCVLAVNISVRPADILLSVENSEWQIIASAGRININKIFMSLLDRNHLRTMKLLDFICLFWLKALLWFGLFPLFQSASIFLSPFSKDNRPEHPING